MPFNLCFHQWNLHVWKENNLFSILTKGCVFSLKYKTAILKNRSVTFFVAQSLCSVHSHIYMDWLGISIRPAIPPGRPGDLPVRGCFSQKSPGLWILPVGEFLAITGQNLGENGQFLRKLSQFSWNKIKIVLLILKNRTKIIHSMKIWSNLVF